MPIAQRIVSFLPSATEMVCALGLEDRLVGVTHECDYPPSVKHIPVVVSSAVPVEEMTEAEIDTTVAERVQAGLSVYRVDKDLLKELAPDLVLVQDLCDVCAPSGDEVSRALKALPKAPEIVHLTPKSLADILKNLLDVGRAAGCPEKAEGWIRTASQRLDRVRGMTRGLASRPRVFCMEWLDPLYCSGHWVPELVEIAGGIDQLSQLGSDSIPISWAKVVAWQPEALFVMPCGCHLKKVLELAAQLAGWPGWPDIPAVRKQQVFALDASSYFARPGPRVVDGAELLAHLLHPEVFSWSGPTSAFARLEIVPVE